MNRLHRQSVTTVPSDVSAQESLCAALLAHSPDVMFRLDHALRFVYVNPAVTRWTGLKPEAFHGKTGVEAGLREWVWAQLAEKCREALASGKIAHTEFSDNTPQGLLHFEARLIPEFGDDGRVATLLGIVTDITDSWRMQSALRDSEINFHLLADYAPGIVWISSAEGNVEYVNHRFFEVTGLSAAAPLKGQLGGGHTSG
jgi:PAS domain S-box-containing protein